MEPLPINRVSLRYSTVLSAVLGHPKLQALVAHADVQRAEAASEATAEATRSDEEVSVDHCVAEHGTGRESPVAFVSQLRFRHGEMQQAGQHDRYPHRNADEELEFLEKNLPENMRGGALSSDVVASVGGHGLVVFEARDVMYDTTRPDEDKLPAEVLELVATNLNLVQYEARGKNPFGPEAKNDSAHLSCLEGLYRAAGFSDAAIVDEFWFEPQGGDCEKIFFASMIGIRLPAYTTAWNCDSSSRIYNCGYCVSFSRHNVAPRIHTTRRQ